MITSFQSSRLIIHAAGVIQPGVKSNTGLCKEGQKNTELPFFSFSVFSAKNYPIIRMSEANEKKTRDGKYDDRPMCKYGADCYRKNPAHFAEYRHPGTCA